MKNKFLIVLFVIITFGLFLIPFSYAKDFYSNQLDNVNRIEYINQEYFRSTNQYRFDCYFNTSNLSANLQYYLFFQAYKTDDLNTPLSYNSMVNSVVVLPSGSNITLTWDSTLKCYVSNQKALNFFNGAYIRVVLGSGNYDRGSYFNDYCFQIQLGITNTSLTNFFVPNTYYNLNSANDYGYFNYSKAYLQLQSQQPRDYSDNLITYNRVGLNDLYRQVYEINNVNSYQYSLIITFDNAFIRDLPNFSIKYLQLDYITINGTRYSYENALNNFDWLYPNILLYSDNATLFVNKDDVLNDYTTYISRMEFRLPDYDFKSSSYFNSNYGLLNYLKYCCITSLDSNSYASYEQGYNQGILYGYNSGYQVGYNEGATMSSGTGFDSLMFSVADVPMKIISSILNFEILGFNLLGFFMGLITLMLFINLMRKFKE